MRQLLIAALLPLSACHGWDSDGAGWGGKGKEIKPSGSTGTRSFAATGFTKVDLRGSDDVDVTIGKDFAVTAEGDTAVLDQLKIDVDGGTLKVGRKDNSWFADDKGARIHVVLPRLAGASVAGSGDMTVERAEGDFNGAVVGAGNLKVAALSGGKADLSITGSGDLSIGGAVGNLRVNIAGSGDVDATKLSASGADISIAGSGSVRGVVKGDAKVSLMGSGDVVLTGGAKCSTSAMGSGEAHCS
jgi:hypothetical protein